MPYDPRRGGVSGRSEVSGGPAQTPIEFDGLNPPPSPPPPPGVPPVPPPMAPPEFQPSHQIAPTAPANQGASALPNDLIGDIPPPPVPPPPISGPGVSGIPGTEAGTFSRPGSRGVLPLHTAAFTNRKPQRFGPGVPTVGASPDAGIGISPDDAAEILRRLAGGAQG